MKHPTDDILLAYVRNQQGQWQADTREHLTSCLICSRRCAELKHIGHTIEDWTHGYQKDAAYATVSKRVLRNLHTAQSARTKSSLRPRIHLSVVMVFAALCLIVLVGFTAQLTGSFASPFKWSSLPLLPSHMTVNTPQPPTATPAITTGSAGNAITATIKTNCTTDADVKEHHLHICGSNFTPGGSVVIAYTLIDGKIKKHDVQVDENGAFIDILRINSCNDIPTAIDATNTKDSRQTVHYDKYIEFGNC